MNGIINIIHTSTETNYHYKNGNGFVEEVSRRQKDMTLTWMKPHRLRCVYSTDWHYRKYCLPKIDDESPVLKSAIQSHATDWNQKTNQLQWWLNSVITWGKLFLFCQKKKSNHFTWLLVLYSSFQVELAGNYLIFTWGLRNFCWKQFSSKWGTSLLCPFLIESPSNKIRCRQKNNEIPFLLLQNGISLHMKLVRLF